MDPSGHRARSLQAGPTAARPTYYLVQGLRAVAALAVVMHHATQALHERSHLIQAEWAGGASGVDVFFVISGFVMTLSAAPLVSTGHHARTFMARRLERIVPMYWLLTAFKAFFVQLRPSSSLNGLGSAWHVLASFLFLPAFSRNHTLEPLLVVGWTLNLEMLFYVLFATALAVRIRPELFLFPALILVSGSAFVALPQGAGHPFSLFYRNPIVLEFLFGVVLAKERHRIRRLTWPLAASLLLAGFACLFLWSWPETSLWRFVGWGLPALAVVGSSIALESRLAHRMPRWLLELGDASYSTYLVHGFTLPLIGLGVMAWVSRMPGGVALCFILLVALSVLAGEITYRTVELPIMRWLKGRRHTAVPANA